MMISQKDIAHKLGLSQATISKSLRNDPEIDQATRQRVQAAAEEMGYQINPMGAGLAHFKRTTKIKPIHAELGWINAWPDPKAYHRYLELERYWQSASACAEKHGYRLEELALKDFGTIPRLVSVLEARGIKGVLVPPGAIPEEWKNFPLNRFAVAHIGRPDPKVPIHSISSDQVTNAMLAYDSIRVRGYRRVGYVGSRWRGLQFGAGFLWAQQGGDDENQTTPDEEQLPPFFIDHESPEHERRLSAWIQSAKPDAIFTDRPDLLKMLSNIGVRVPEDIGVAATTVLDCQIDAGIYQNPEEIGRVGILVLISLLSDNDRGIPSIPRQILIPGKWVDGKTLPDRTGVKE